MHRIVVTGSECTGKTTLARELATRLGISWVPEQARAWAERVARPLTADDVSAIASAQISAEDAALAEARRRGHRAIVLDTDLLSTVVYARHYYGTCPAWIEAETRSRRADLYLLAEIDLPWIPDGVRDREHARELIQALFRQALDEYRAVACDVRGVGPERLDTAMSCVRNTLGAWSREA